MFNGRTISAIITILFLTFACGEQILLAQSAIRAGAAKVDITPQKMPAICNGGFQKRIVDSVTDPLYARAIVIEKQQFVMAMAVVDNCMISQKMCDKIKAIVSAKTGIAASRILICATHCHSAPALMPIFSAPVDEDYAKYVPTKIADAIIQAHARMQPAKIGTGFAFAPDTVFCRRYVMREGTASSLPPAFTGCEKNIAQMNPGAKRMKGDALYPTSIPDPMVSVIAISSSKGQPIALFANFSSHYAGAPGISADFHGVFCNKIGEYLNASEDFVPMISTGCCGDTNTNDPDNPKKVTNMHTVGDTLARAALVAWKRIKFHDDLPLDMIEDSMTLPIRKPRKEDVAQAHAWLKENADKSKTTEYVFANETIGIDSMPPTKSFKVQALRIGELGIAAVPVQPYAWTGLQIRHMSPLSQTFTIALANGSSGYIPPDRDFELGGYTTWRVRTNCLEKGSEKKVREKMIDLLHKVAAVQ